jgi:hypothetical protein
MGSLSVYPWYLPERRSTSPWTLSPCRPRPRSSAAPAPRTGCP